VSQQHAVAPTDTNSADSGRAASDGAVRAAEIVNEEDAQRVFNFSIIVSAVRCTLTYVIFPFVAPFAGLADFGPVIGVVVGVIAIVANIVSIRRMGRAQHKWRVPVSIINLAMIGLVLYLVTDDLLELLG